MASETMNITEDTEMAECDGDKVVTMMDVLQEQQDFEEDANAVLGASDDKNCTYTKGYIKRQAIYACLTCCPDIKEDPSKRAGVCLACSLNCHENHDLVELYTKRNFRCDCGNPKFNSNPCQFTTNKPDLNDDNIYNQNFSGLYCICKRPYPDPEASFEDDMIQCIICEDWLHASHLDAVVPANDQYAEMICKGCMEKNEFLYDYSNLAVNFEIVDVVTVNGNHSDINLNNGDIDMADDKDKKPASNEDVRHAESSEPKRKSTEIHDNKQTEDIDKDSNVNLKTSTLEDKQTVNDEKKDNDMVTEEVQEVNDAAPKTTDKNDTNETSEEPKEGNDMETSEERKEQNEAGEQVTNEVNNDKTDSISQLEKKDDISESSDNAEKPAESSDSMEDKISSEGDNKGTEASNQEEKKNSSESSEEKSVAVSKNIEVPDTSQESLENMEDKTDSVMDAIDALLESTTETKDSDKENKDDSKGKDESKIMETSNDKLTNNVDNNKNAEDLEATDSPSQNESSDKEMSNENNEPVTIETDNTEKSVETETMVNGDNSEKVTVQVDDSSKTENNDESNSIDNETKTTETFNDNKRKLSITDESSPKKVKLNSSKCQRPTGVKRVCKGASFWPSNFRQKLCTCGECISMYKDLNVLFLTDLEDTVSYYESLGKEMIDGGVSQYEKGLQALSSLDRIQQINALTEYNKMRDKLLDFLKSFKDRKEIVKEEDIKAFFAGMKPRREPDGVYFCR